MKNNKLLTFIISVIYLTNLSAQEFNLNYYAKKSQETKEAFVQTYQIDFVDDDQYPEVYPTILLVGGAYFSSSPEDQSIIIRFEFNTRLNLGDIGLKLYAIKDGFREPLNTHRNTHLYSEKEKKTHTHEFDNYLSFGAFLSNSQIKVDTTIAANDNNLLYLDKKKIQLLDKNSNLKFNNILDLDKIEVEFIINSKSYVYDLLTVEPLIEVEETIHQEDIDYIFLEEATNYFDSLFNSIPKPENVIIKPDIIRISKGLNRASMLDLPSSSEDTYTPGNENLVEHKNLKRLIEKKLKTFSNINNQTAKDLAIVLQNLRELLIKKPLKTSNLNSESKEYFQLLELSIFNCIKSINKANTDNFPDLKYFLQELILLEQEAKIGFSTGSNSVFNLSTAILGYSNITLPLDENQYLLSAQVFKTINDNSRFYDNSIIYYTFRNMRKYINPILWKRFHQRQNPYYGFIGRRKYDFWARDDDTDSEIYPVDVGSLVTKKQTVVSLNHRNLRYDIFLNVFLIEEDQIKSATIENEDFIFNKLNQQILIYQSYFYLPPIKIKL